MVQKYKFFIKDAFVEFRQNKRFGDNNQTLEQEWINRLQRQDVQNIKVVYWNDLEGFISLVKRRLRWIDAAGGFVVNSKRGVLMIFRRGFWDLPKGKQDPGETIEQTALREVEEECGVKNLLIESEVFQTFHLYSEGGETIVKASHWFKMSTNDINLIPQTEEEITIAQWVALPVDGEIMKGAFASIREVITHFSS